MRPKTRRSASGSVIPNLLMSGPMIGCPRKAGEERDPLVDARRCPDQNEMSHPTRMRDREAPSQVPAHRVAYHIHPLGADAVGEVEKPLGGGSTVVDAPVVDLIAQARIRSVGHDHVSRKPTGQERPFATMRQAAVNQHGRARTVATADHVRAPPLAILGPTALALEAVVREQRKPFPPELG